MTIDPSAIEIRNDPLINHMSGITRHKGIQFDVPYMTKIEDGLWLGGCQNGLVLPQNIKHVVSLYPWESYTVEHELDSMLSIKMYDSEDQNMKRAEALADWVYGIWWGNNGDILVHCQAGLNRSSLIVALAIARRARPMDDIINLIRTKRSEACLCNDSFVKYLKGR